MLQLLPNERYEPGGVGLSLEYGVQVVGGHAAPDIQQL